MKLLLIVIFLCVFLCSSGVAENDYLPAFMSNIHSYNSTMDPFTSGFSFRSGDWVYCPSGIGIEESSIIRFQYDNPSLIEVVRVFKNEKFIPTFPFDIGQGILLTDAATNRLVVLDYDGKNYRELFQFKEKPGFEILVGNYLYYSQGEDVCELNYVTLDQRVLATYPGEQEMYGEYAAFSNRYIFITVHGRGVYRINVITGELFDLSYIFKDYPDQLLVDENIVLGYNHDLSYISTDYNGENKQFIEVGEYYIAEVTNKYILANNDSLFRYLFKQEGESFEQIDLSSMVPIELELPIGSVYLYDDRIFVEDYLKQIDAMEPSIVVFQIE